MSLRRTLLALTILAILPMAAGSAFAQTAEEAASFIQGLGNRLVAVVNGQGSAKDKSEALAKIVDQDVDVDGVARFCLGRFWHAATPQQQKEYQALFHKVLLISITSKMGEYKGVRFTIGRTTPRAEGQVVATTIAGPQRTPAEIDWVVKDVNGSPKIVDVIAEGTSLRLTQRSDYTSYLIHHNDSVQALVDALRRQVSANG